MQPTSSKPGLTGKHTKMKWLLLVIFCLLFSRCRKEENTKVQEFEVEVLSENCGGPLVEFKNHLDKVTAITQFSEWSTYVAYNVAPQYRQPGQKLLVRIRTPRQEEEVVCANAGLRYPAITLISARPLE
jgi:hypothetical protein